MSQSKPNTIQTTPFALKKHFFISLAVLAGVMLAVAIASRFVNHGPQNAIRGAKAIQDYAALEREYRELVSRDVYNLQNHRGYLEAHTANPRVMKALKKKNFKVNQELIAQYRIYSQSKDPVIKDIGFYGLGYLYVKHGDAQKALEWLNRVADRSMPYLNNTIGYVHLNLQHRRDLARDFFNKEIAIKGNVPAAVANLGQLYLESGDYNELSNLSRDPELGKYIPLSHLRYLDLKQNKPFAYLRHLFKTEAATLTWVSLLTSLAIALMFLIYIYFVDIFEKERIALLLSVFGMGMLSAVLATLLYDLAGAALGLHLAGQIGPDLVFFIFGVGLIEESVKLLPVLFVIYSLEEWNESVDVLIYACVSALGFACLENAGYFSNVAIGLIMGRTMSAVVMHVCLTCLAAYGIFYYRYKTTRSGPLCLFVCFGGAVLLHGLYDFFIAYSQGLYSLLILVYLMLAFRNMLQNALDQSEFMGPSPLKVNLSLYLFYGVLCVLFMQFSVLALQYGPDLAMGNLFSNVAKFYLLVILLVANLGRLQVVKNKWNPLFRGAKKENR